MKSLVTGASGFIGGHLVGHLLEKGHKVSCLVRATSDTSRLRNLPVRLVCGDCERAETLREAVEGMDYVFHLAARIKALDWASYYRANSEGTRNLAEACAEHNPRVKRFVYVSSIAAAGPSEKGRPKNEDDRCAPRNDYGRTKLFGEEAVKNMGNRLPFVIIRPPNVLGPGQEELCAVFRILEKRLMPLLGNGDRQLSIVFVQDLVRAILMAATHDATVGKTYYVTDGREYSWREIAYAAARQLGVSGFLVPVPYPVLLVLASLAGAGARAMGRESFFSGRQVKYLRDAYLIYDGSRAEREFGFRASVGLEPGLEAAVERYRRDRRREPRKAQKP